MDPAPLGRTDVAEALSALPLFADVDRTVIARLAQLGRPELVPSETELFRQGDRPAELVILLDGRACLLGSAPHRAATIVDIVAAVAPLGLAAALTGEPHLTGARTMTPARILSVSAAELRILVAQDTRLATAMIAAVAHHYRLMVRQVKDLKLRSAAQRLACFLLELSQEEGGRQQIRLPFGKQLLAARLGTTPEHLSRAFATLRQWAVETHGSRVTLGDVGALARFAEPDDSDHYAS